MNSTFRARWLASSEVISQVLFTSEQPKKNKRAFAAICSQIKSLFGPLVVQLVWYILKQLFTSVSVKVVDIYLHFGEKYYLAILLVYLNSNNAAEGENNIKYANSYPMNWTVKNWFAQDIFESLWWEMNWNCYWVGCFVGLNTEILHASALLFTRFWT